ncbi:MAG: hypothetical protein IPG47_11395 [Thermoflexaceae bacterium]|nr:hypothetical protein [Thermoflexaceae bacterium]
MSTTRAAGSSAWSRAKVCSPSSRGSRGQQHAADGPAVRLVHAHGFFAIGRGQDVDAEMPERLLGERADHLLIVHHQDRAGPAPVREFCRVLDWHHYA